MTRAERRLLLLAGAPRSLSSRSLVAQVTLPAAVGVLAAALVSLGLSLGFTRLLTYTEVTVPVPGISAVALAAVIAPLLTTLLVVRVSRSESVNLAEE